MGIPKLPSNETIKQYMSYLGGKEISNNYLDEIKKYKESLPKMGGKPAFPNLKKQVFQNDEERKREQAPIPLALIYKKMFVFLNEELKSHMKTLVFNIFSYLGNSITSHIQSKDDIRKQFEDKNSLLSNILSNKKFGQLVMNVKNDFDIGVDQFIYYNKLEKPTKERIVKVDKKKPV